MTRRDVAACILYVVMTLASFAFGALTQSAISAETQAHQTATDQRVADDLARMHEQLRLESTELADLQTTRGEFLSARQSLTQLDREQQAIVLYLAGLNRRVETLERK